MNFYLKNLARNKYRVGKGAAEEKYSILDSLGYSLYRLGSKPAGRGVYVTVVPDHPDIGWFILERFGSCYHYDRAIVLLYKAIV